MNPFQRTIDRIRKIKSDLISNRETDALKIAFDTTALIKLRIQSKGENADGAQFTPYTPDYKKEREKKGYQVGFVDFTRTGRMFASIGPEVTASDVFTATVEIKGRDEKTRAMLRGHAGKRGNILRPSKAEIELVKRANRERILKYFRA
jgi:hypothetical protein